MSLTENYVDAPNQFQETFSSQEAFAAIALLAIAPDGHLSREQTESTSVTLSRIRLFHNYSPDSMNRMFEKLVNVLQTSGLNALFNTAKESLPPQLRESAFAMATELLLSDSIITEEERYFLKDLCQALDLETDIASKIVEVITIKNRA
ncbi:MAG: tellurite resistance TerB family protein [Cyanobacteria bacterium P01_A01_bin.84]